MVTIQEGKEKTSSIQSKFLNHFWRGLTLISYSIVGMGVSFHKTYDIICVIDFAAEYSDHLENHQQKNT